MIALAEGHVPVGLAAHVEALGVRELRRVAVGGADADGDKSAFGQGPAAEGHRLAQPPVVELDRTVVTQHFLYGRRDQARIGPQPGGFFRVVQQQPGAVADQVGGGFMARVEHEDAVVQQLRLGQLPAVALALDQAREDIGLVVAGMPRAVGDEPAQVGEEVGDRAVAALEQGGVRGGFEGGEDRKRPAPQRLAVGLGHVEQVADDLDRDLGREVVDEVDLAPLGEGVEEVVDEAHHAGLHAHDRALVERAQHQAAHAGVQRRVVEHEARGVVLEQRGIAELGAELGLLVGQRVRVAIDGHHVVVAREEHAAAVQFVHRVVLAQGGVVRIGVVEEGRRDARQLEFAREGAGIHSAIMPA